MIMTFAGTWFGIGVFYTILYQLFMALFNGSVLLQNVRSRGAGEGTGLLLYGSAAAGKEERTARAIRAHACPAAHRPSPSYTACSLCAPLPPRRLAAFCP